MRCLLPGSILLLFAACRQQQHEAPREPPRAADEPAPAEVAPAPQPSQPEPARVDAPVPAATASVRSKTSQGNYVRERDNEPPEEGAVRAKRLVEADGGYLDLFRSADGKTLWGSRGWDDGTSHEWTFVLEAHQLGWSDAVLQFVDGVTERPDDPNTIPPDEVRRVGDGRPPYRMFAEAWLVSAEARMAMRPPSSPPVPVVHVGPGSGDPKPLQWMIFRPRCPEVGKDCVYFGRARAVLKHVVELDAKRAADDYAIDFWIYPEG
jgi:hypothetical protein